MPRVMVLVTSERCLIGAIIINEWLTHQSVAPARAVLATGMQPSLALQGVPADLQMDTGGFIISDFDKGMIATGCAKKAADVVTCTQSSTAAALKAIQVSRR